MYKNISYLWSEFYAQNYRWCWFVGNSHKLVSNHIETFIHSNIHKNNIKMVFIWKWYAVLFHIMWTGIKLEYSIDKFVARILRAQKGKPHTIMTTTIKNTHSVQMSATTARKMKLNQKTTINKIISVIWLAAHVYVCVCVWSVWDS